MPYNPDIHHRRSIRLQGYDYRQAGAYYVTICLHGGWLQKDGMTSATNDLRLGDITEGILHLNEYGDIVHDQWVTLPDHHTYLELDEFVIMPNHFHGILVFIENSPSSLSKIIGAFKSFSALRINKLRNVQGVPVWKRDYYEHIIRDEADLNRIREYIMNNPTKWSQDTYYIS